MCRWIVNHLREDDRTCRREGPSRPPKVQRRRVPVADRLLVRRGDVYSLKRKSDFNEFLAGSHEGFCERARRSANVKFTLAPLKSLVRRRRSKGRRRK